MKNTRKVAEEKKVEQMPLSILPSRQARIHQCNIAELKKHAKRRFSDIVKPSQLEIETNHRTSVQKRKSGNHESLRKRRTFRSCNKSKRFVKIAM